MKIAFIGKFTKLHDEEYIAQSFESLGHEVTRLKPNINPIDLQRHLSYKYDMLLYCKWDNPGIKINTKTVCWLFDLYFDYAREYQVNIRNFFKSQYVFTTDGGHGDKWKQYGINHQCLRQGIFKDECFIKESEPIYDVVFVGSESPLYLERNQIMEWASKNYSFRWFGKKNTDEVRGTQLNDLYAKAKIVIGNSYYSPYYWSNRVVETLGRGGFLIHQEVEGIKEEYPYLVTYKRGDLKDLKSKIDYYLSHDEEREDIRKKNFEWVKERYTMDKKCAELIAKL